MNMTLLFLVSCISFGTKSSTDEPQNTDDTGFDDTADTVIEDTIEPDPDSGLDTSTDTDTGSTPSTPYNLAYFKSMHNAYSGEERGTIHEQLDAGFRGLEFDIHDNDFENIGDYQLGHFSPGGEVERGHGNPNTVLLSDWLSHVKQWSILNQGHAPITITIDFKDDLTDNIDYMHGSMDKLNDIFRGTPKCHLCTDVFAGEWPTVHELRNRFVLFCLDMKNLDNSTNETVDTIQLLPSMILDKLSRYMTPVLVHCGIGQDRCAVMDLWNGNDMDATTLVKSPLLH